MIEPAPYPWSYGNVYIDVLTPWFTPDQQPVRVGVYSTEWKSLPYQPWCNYWDGGQWLAGGPLPADATSLRVPLDPENVANNMRFWRGLTESYARSLP